VSRIVVSRRSVAGAVPGCEIPWNGVPRRVRAPCASRPGRRRYSPSPSGERRAAPESDCPGAQSEVGGGPHLKLNIGERPIANKYREGKMKRTLRRESKAPEIVRREAFEVSGSPWNPLGDVDELTTGGWPSGLSGSPPFSGLQFVRFDEGFEAGRRRLDRREDGCEGGSAGFETLVFRSAVAPRGTRRRSGRGKRTARARAFFGGRGGLCLRLEKLKARVGNRRSSSLFFLEAGRTSAWPAAPTEWPRPTRLETRTKESDARASVKVNET
jgi:hypothetical protein